MAPDEMFASQEWTQYVKTVSRFWASFYTSWLKLHMCILVVDFHNLKTNLKQELAQIGDFLGMERRWLNETHLDCVTKNSEGSFKRRTKRNVTEFYREDLKRIVDEKARILSELVWHKVHYRLDFSWK